MRRTTTFGGPPPPLDLHDPEQVRAASGADVALALLRAGFDEAPGEVLSRRELVRRFVEGLDAGLQREMLRRLAEAFQTLELVGAVCEDIEQSSDGFYFATSFGQYVLKSSAPREELTMRMRS
jgi:hypothetical protein